VTVIGVLLLHIGENILSDNNNNPVVLKAVKIMKKILIALLFLAVTRIYPGESSIPFNDLLFEFYPCNVEDDFINLEKPKIISWDSEILVFKHDDKEYRWKYQKELYKDKKNLGCYILLCVSWNDKKNFDLIADSTYFR